MNFSRNKERIRKFKETGDSRYIYQNELDKACFQHDMTHGDPKDLPGRTEFFEVLRDEAFNIAKNPKFEGYQRGIGATVHYFFDKNFSGSNTSGVTIENKVI